MVGSAIIVLSTKSWSIRAWYGDFADSLLQMQVQQTCIWFSVQWMIVMDSLRSWDFQNVKYALSLSFTLCVLFIILCSFGFPETAELDHDVHMDVCWRRLEGDNMCSDPLQGRQTTYTECCCLYGFAWSNQCAFCPRRDSGEKQDFGYFVK